MSAQLPVLQVALPLIAAPICVLLRFRDAAWALAAVSTWASFGISALLLAQVYSTGVISYELGGWPPPWGIEYRVDALNAYVLLVVSGVSAAVILFARDSILAEFGRNRDYLFYCAYLLAFCGLLGVTITGDAFNLFVFLEISSLGTYMLIASGRDRRALVASYQYLILGTIGATFIVIGVGFLYALTGTLNMADLAVRVRELGPNTSIIAAFSFLVVGTSLKLALFPLHLWLPNAYTFAPSMVSAFLAATATKVALYVLLRFVFTIFGVEFSFESLWLGLPLAILAIVGIFVTSLVAIFQNDIKRMLAFSSVAQIGYMVLGISLHSLTGVAAGIMHLFNHALMKGALFCAVGCLVYRVGSAGLDAFAGAGRRMPWTMAAFCTGGLSLVGVPLTAGFVGKWYLVLAVIERGWWPIAALLLLSSMLAVIYIWRVVEVAYFRDPPPGSTMKEAPLSLLLPTWALAFANIWFGVETSLNVGGAFAAAQSLLGGVAP
ncbi:MAG: monovalent cation/H+ antiporter subunit D family protein [Alphaproteobacteria bacterium]